MTAEAQRSDTGVLMQDREKKVEALRAALIVGEGSGAATPFDFDDFVARKRGEYQQGSKRGSRAETKTK